MGETGLIVPRGAQALLEHQDLLAQCRRCARMQSTPDIGKPFAWTAGKMLFKWFSSIGLDEERFRGRVYMAAVCRCFPGKRPAGGDRVPDPDEIANCSSWLDAEIAINRPRLVLP